MTTLRQGLAAGPAHAYLFVGPRQAGKATLARELAQALNCRGPDVPCGGCAPCRRIAQGIFADLHLVAPEEGHREIRIHQVREVERLLSLSPYEGRYRVVIVDGAEAMNEEAQNAFLKTLEEPPSSAVLALVTAREEALLPTVRSRCQRIELRALSTAEIEAVLHEQAVEPERARLLARLAAGRSGWALAAAADPQVLSLRREALDQLTALCRSGLVERFATATKLAAQRREAQAILEYWSIWWRDILLVQGGAPEGIINLDRQADLLGQAPCYKPSDVVFFLRELEKTQRYLEENVNIRLALEVLFLALPAQAVQVKEGRP